MKNKKPINCLLVYYLWLTRLIPFSTCLNEENAPRNNIIVILIDDLDFVLGGMVIVNEIMSICPIIQIEFDRIE